MSEQLVDNTSEHSTCQKCGKKTPNLSQLDSGLKLSLTKTGHETVPSLVCGGCLKELKSSASLGTQKQAKEEIKAEQKSKIWTSRLDLVRHGRSFLQRKEYAASAVCYEKYIKVLSIVMEKGKMDLDPKLFNDNPKEITIISSVLWDLMLIYDSHPKFVSKQKESAALLAKFLRYSPVYNSIVRKAELEAKRAKNPQTFKDFLKLCDVQATRCFIANSAFETRTHPTVKTLCFFRDQILKKSALGRKLVYIYYTHSPILAVALDASPRLKSMLRPVLRGVAILLKLFFRLPDA
jgi:hypothetical protein